MGRSPCCDEKIHVKKGPWTPEEDKKLVDYIAVHGHRSWRHLPKNAGLNRCGKSCRLRWTNYLRPDIRRGNFSPDEEHQIIHLHSLLGNKWSKISTHLPGRTDNEIKNYWNTHLRKKLLSVGIDPATHRRRAVDLDVVLSTLLASAAGSLGGGLPAVNPSFDIATQLRLQADAAQYVAGLQVLENLVKLVIPNPAPPPSMGAVINHLFGGRQLDIGSLNPALNTVNYPNNEMATLMEKKPYQTHASNSGSSDQMTSTPVMMSSSCNVQSGDFSNTPPLLASSSPDEKYEVAECMQEDYDDQQIKFPTLTSDPEEDFSSWKDILEQLSWSDE